MASIVTLRDGTNLICEVREIFKTEQVIDPETGEETENRVGIGLQLSDPFVLEMIEFPEAEDPNERSKVKYTRWNPFTLERVFKVNYESVTCVSAPDPNLDQAFAEKVEFFNSYETATEETDDTATETAE